MQSWKLGILHIDGIAELKTEPSSENVFSANLKIQGLGSFQFLKKLVKFTLVWFTLAKFG